MPDQRLKILFKKCINSAASPEETSEFMNLSLLPENEEELRRLINESMFTENEYSLEPSSREAIIKSIFDAANKPVITPKALKLHRFRPAIYWAAASIILLLASAYYFKSFNDRGTHTDNIVVSKSAKPVQKDIQPGVSQAVLTLASGKRIILDSSANGDISGQQGARLTNSNGFLAYKSEILNEREPEYNTVTVPRKGQYQLELSDGTKVWLNASSSLRFPVAFTGDKRLVELTGEGYFEIAKDPSKPFHVKIRGTDVQALGTHFNIMAYSNETSLQTTLLEGSVKVIHIKDSCVLKPGQVASVFENSKTIEVKSADVDQAIAWKDGYFLFNGKTPLSSVMRQLERWYDIEVHYDGTVPDPNFGGGIQRSLPLSGVLSVLEESGIKFRINNNQLTLLK